MAFSEGGGWYRKKPRGLMGFSPSMSGLPSLAGRPNFNQASATKKGFFGKMSPEELKDFKETLAEMDFGVDQEFLAGGNFGRTQEYAHQPFLFDESTAAEYQRRRKLNPYV